MGGGAGSGSLSVSLCTLYLPGLARPFDPPRRRWRQVDAVLRRGGCLSDAGLGQEALVLGSPEVLARAEALLSAGLVVTAACEGYPRVWLDRLVEGAPPALWMSGSMPSRAFIGVVGSREVDGRLKRFAAGVAAAARRLGFSVVSGGAAGCDRAAAPDVEIVPYGLPGSCDVAALRGCGAGEDGKCGSAEGWKGGEFVKGRERGPTRLSLAKPDEQFSTALAMERNGLIYSLSEATVVVQARFKQGGSWIGAVDALRRRRCRVLVRDDPADPAMRALIALGGVPLRSPDDLAEALTLGGPQGLLFPPGAGLRAGTISA